MRIVEEFVQRQRAEERAEVWRDAAALFVKAFERNDVVQDILDECEARARGGEEEVGT